jgi:argininosuccinate lyase
MSLWLRDELRKVESYLVDFLKVMAARAEQEISWSCQDTNIFSEPNLSSGVIGCYLTLWRLLRVWRIYQKLLSGSIRISPARKEGIFHFLLTLTLSRSTWCRCQTGNCFGVDREAMTKELGFDRLVSGA